VSTPLVSIGLPVYNGEAFLRETLASLQGQTLPDFELIISDNASTDRTGEICMEASRKDPRIRYVRQPRNIGAPANWNFVARQARGQYFKWSSDSDISAPHLLDACVRCLTEDPGLVLCFGQTTYIDENGQSVKMPLNDVEALDARPSDRFRRVCLNLCLNNEQYGVIRRDALLRTRLDRPYPHGDLVLMAELAMLGKFKVLSDTLLIRRAAAGHWTGLMSTEQFDSLFWPTARPKHAAPFIRRHLDYVRVALTSPVDWSERARATAFALRFAYWRKAEIARELMQPVRRPRAGNPDAAA
jgi:glycosyltransferase involved in cell wall biosynthesis